MQFQSPLKGDGMAYKKVNKKDKSNRKVKEKISKNNGIRSCDKDSKKELEKLAVIDDINTLIISDVVEKEDEKEDSLRRSNIEDILFKLPYVEKPLIGTPKQVQKELDKIALRIQKRPKSKCSQKLFRKIHLYMHGYLINIVLKQFPYIKGMQTSDIYQQTLMALWAKAIPGFRNDKGMSFLNFAKMCIRRHLITILNTSKTRQKDQSMNQAMSLDSHPSNVDEDSNSSFSNIIPDKEESVDKKTASEEAYKVTRDTLLNILSDFEKVVLNEYLATSTYKEIATNIAFGNKKKCIPKSVDNALLRIRKKALLLKQAGKLEEIPIFIV